jgi:pimeloyl-ACP methyl ester carboxylesterase
MALLLFDRSDLCPNWLSCSHSISPYSPTTDGDEETAATKKPYAVEREIEDIEALIDGAGGFAYLYGVSSGACLALETAIKLGDKVKKLALYEAPYNSDATSSEEWREYTTQLTNLLADNRRGDAVALFMKFVGTPNEQIEGMRKAPMW